MDIRLIIPVCRSLFFPFSGTAYQLLDRDPHLLTWEDQRGWTPLHYAAYYRFDLILDLMLNKQNKVGYQFVPREDIPPPHFVAIFKGTFMDFKSDQCTCDFSSSKYTAHYGVSRG